MTTLLRKLITDLVVPGAPRHLIAVSDIAGLDETLRSAVSEQFSGRSHPLLRQEQWLALRPYSPLLLAARSAEIADCGSLVEEFQGRLHNALHGWIISTLPPAELASHLSHATLAQGPDGGTYLLRHYDPFVLPVLHQTADPAWWKAFIAPVVSWWIPRADSERRLWGRLPGNGVHARKPPPPPTLIMDAHLWNALSADPFPHRLLREAEEHEPSLFDTDCRNVRLARVMAHLDAARSLGLSSSESLHDYVFMALSRPAQQLHNDRHWQHAVQAAASGNGRLGNLYLALLSRAA